MLLESWLMYAVPRRVEIREIIIKIYYAGTPEPRNTRSYLYSKVRVTLTKYVYGRCMECATILTICVCNSVIVKLYWVTREITVSFNVLKRITVSYGYCRVMHNINIIYTYTSVRFLFFFFAHFLPN